MGNGTIYQIRVVHRIKKNYNSIKARFYGNDLFEINNTLICTEPTDINSTSKTNESHRLNSTQYKQMIYTIKIAQSRVKNFRYWNKTTAKSDL